MQDKPFETSLEIGGVTSLKKLRALRPDVPVDTLTYTNDALFRAVLAREICQWPGVHHIALHCTASRAAVRECIGIPGLKSLYVLAMDRHGSLLGMALSDTLSSLNSWSGLSSAEICELAKLPNMESLNIQNSRLSKTSTEALAKMRSLRHLDIEGSNFDDDMAAILASSSSLEGLYVCRTKLSATGLKSICQMRQLKALDIWALDIQEPDLDYLKSLEALEYLSLGGYEGQTTLTANGVLPRLAALPSLKRLWLDGIKLNKRDVAELNERYDEIQIT